MKPLLFYDIADSISHKLAKNALAGMVNGKVMDLSTEVSDDAEVRILTWDDDEGKMYSAIAAPTSWLKL